MPIKTLFQREKSIWIVLQQQLSGSFNCSATFDMSTSVCKCLIACVYVWETATSAVFLCGYLLNDASRKEWDRKRNLIPICWLDIGLLKNVNGHANWWGEQGLRLSLRGQDRIKQTRDMSMNIWDLLNVCLIHPSEPCHNPKPVTHLSQI